jgi:ABC-type amino acid transport substrate-binding protein
MFASVIIISSYTAAIASALTVEGMNAAVRGPEDLPRAAIGTVANSAAAGWLQEHRLDFEGYRDLAAAMADLEQGDLDAVVYDAPILRSLTTEGGEVQVLPHVLRHESYALAMPPESSLREELNRALLEALGTARWAALRERYLGN